MKRGDQDRLLHIAREAILRHMEKRERPDIGEEGEPAELMQERASFVTLSIDGQLRGCIGMLRACRPLIEDVVENACAAAFDDPRFPPLQRDEFDQLEIHISVLSLPEELHFSSEEELLSQIRQGVDGLILRDGMHSGTFLPCVWAELPEKEEFLRHLKMKAGLAEDFWSEELRVLRYTAEYFPA
jgi:AmmeMemoRadiSam system protein A